MSQPSDSDLLDRAVAAIARLRRDGARVHCMTNTVAQNFTANVLLACGAIPSMTVSPDEAADFTRAADALLVNLGTLDADRRTAMPVSVDAARGEGRPVVLDPVMCHLSPPRLAFARALLGHGPLILKANAAEAAALGHVDTACRIVTGSTDRIAGNGLAFGVVGGHALMDRVVAMGCALGALIAALAAREVEPAIAALAAVAWFGAAGTVAGETAKGPGTFVPAFLDALYALDETEIRNRTRLVP